MEASRRSCATEPSRQRNRVVLPCWAMATSVFHDTPSLGAHIVLRLPSGVLEGHPRNVGAGVVGPDRYPRVHREHGKWRGGSAAITEASERQTPDSLDESGVSCSCSRCQTARNKKSRVNRQKSRAIPCGRPIRRRRRPSHLSVSFQFGVWPLRLGPCCSVRVEMSLRQYILRLKPRWSLH